MYIHILLLYLDVYVCARARARVCVCVWIGVCVCVCVWVGVFEPLFIINNTYTYKSVYTYIVASSRVLPSNKFGGLGTGMVETFATIPAD